MDFPASGKLIFAANPWLLAAAAKREGYATDRFRESDIVPDGQVVVIDLDVLLADDSLRVIRDWAEDPELARLRDLWDA